MIEIIVRCSAVIGLLMCLLFAFWIGFWRGTKIAQSTPYNPSGDLISREALKKNCAEVVKASNNSDFIPCPTWNKAMELIDNAPTIPLPILNEQIAWEQGYEAGLAQSVEITEEQAINKLHETGWLIGHDKEMTTRPKGKWIDHKLRDDIVVEHAFKCSVCKQDNGLAYGSDFCPNCGADMRESEADNGNQQNN